MTPSELKVEMAKMRPILQGAMAELPQDDPGVGALDAMLKLSEVMGRACIKVDAHGYEGLASIKNAARELYMTNLEYFPPKPTDGPVSVALGVSTHTSWLLWQLCSLVEQEISEPTEGSD